LSTFNGAGSSRVSTCPPFRAKLSVGPTLGNCLCGPFEFLLDMYHRSQDEAYLLDAYALASLLESFGIEQERLLVWPSEGPYLYMASIMVGYSGVAYKLLRLSAPDRVSHPLWRHKVK